MRTWYTSRGIRFIVKIAWLVKQDMRGLLVSPVWKAEASVGYFEDER